MNVVNLRAPAENRPPVPFDELTIRVALDKVTSQIVENAELISQLIVSDMETAQRRDLSERTLELVRARRDLSLAYAAALAGEAD